VFLISWGWVKTQVNIQGIVEESVNHVTIEHTMPAAQLSTFKNNFMNRLAKMSDLNKDRFEILKLYPTKKGGLEWFSNWKNDKTRYLTEGDYDLYDSKFFYSCGQPNVQLKIDGDGRAIVQKNTTSARLFVNGPWTNTEMTVYVKGFQLADVQLRSRSNHQEECGFGNYLVKFHNIDKKATVEVEPLHPIYQRHLGEVSFDGYPLDKYVGFKQVTRNIDNNSKVNVEGYINYPDSGSDNWQKLTEFVFDGSNIGMNVVKYQPERLACVNKGDMTANDVNKNTLWTHCGQLCWIRVNESNKTTFKYFSVREIYT
jgi:hypothetical protein